jgi:O-antigen/teichoic acid export membrane protein
VHDAGDGPMVMLSLVMSSAVTTLTAYGIALKQIGFRQVRFAGARKLLRSATAIFISDGVSRLMMNGSTLLLSLFATATQVGHFGAAERVASLVISLMVPANQVLVGTVAHALGTSDARNDAYRLMRKALFLLGLFGLAACAGTLLLAPVLVPLVFGPQFQPSVAILQLFAFVFPLAAFNQVTRLYVLLPLRMDARVAQATVIGAACNLLCILLLAADFGGDGVAAARIVGELVTAVALIAVLRQQGLLKRLLGRRRADSEDSAHSGCTQLDISEQRS